MSLYTLCDGVPRADVSPITQTIYSAQYYVETVTTTAVSSNPTQPAPACTINDADCAALHSSYQSARENYLITASGNAPEPVSPACGSKTCYPGEKIALYGSPHYSCSVLAGPVRLIYFPVTTVGGNLCAGNGSTFTRNTTTAQTAVTLGTTFTSGTAYISFQTLYATDLCGNQVGEPLSDLIIPISSGLVSSACGIYHGGHSASLNYADLNWPIPAAAYKCQPRCEGGQNGGPFSTGICSTIYDDYRPILRFPSQISVVQTAWNNCNLGDMDYADSGNQLYDPPIALQPQANIAMPTVSEPPAQTSASPSSPLPALAQQTQALDTAPAVSSKTSDTAPAAVQPSAFDSSSASVPAAVSASSPAPKPAPSANPGGIIAESFGDTSVKQNPPGPSGNQNSASLDNAPPATVVTVSNTPVSVIADANPSNPGGVIIGGQTVRPGAPTTINNVPVSIAGSGGIILGIVTVTAAAPSLTDDDPAKPIATIGTQQIVPNPSNPNGIVIGTQTLNPGQQTTINNVPVSVGTNGVVVLGGSRINIAAASPTNNAALALQVVTAIGSQTITANAGGSLVVGSQTISVGGPAVTVLGETVSLASNGVVINGDTVPFSTAREAAATAARSGVVVTVGGQRITALDPASPDSLRSGIFTPNQVATISGVVVSAGSTALVVGGTTPPFSELPASTGKPGAVLTIGPVTYTAFETSGAIILGTVTLKPNQLATISGEVISAYTGGVVVHGSSIPFSIIAPTLLQGQAVFTAGSRVLTASEVAGRTGVVVVDGSTISIGGPAATINGQTISEGSAGLVVGTRTVPISAVSATQTGAVFTIGSRTYTAFEIAGSPNTVVVDGNTLSIGGPATTIDGQVISEGLNGLVVGGSTTVPFSTVKVTPSVTSANGIPSATGSSQAPAGAGSLRISQGAAAIWSGRRKGGALNVVTWSLVSGLAWLMR
ncbi:hypothetical protein LTR66_006020 [Elasticomyces elasticus]|nr:hypothetical protein LTR66_006020 [Elasticomyces elasticus]